ncbi:MAG: succinate dehydrogenase cytochrome b subunit [Myxococcales bacterium]|nr:succinate dehydrogenase cytochrome b subunit [Myxococcales bacterium]
MQRVGTFYRSVIGKKAIVAATGAILLAFLVFHLIGNLKAFLPDPAPGVYDIDLYSKFLRTVGEPLFPRTTVLWTIRCVLLVALGLHIACVVQLAKQNRDARPVAYIHKPARREATPSARWMLYTGSFLILFIVLHLLQFTTGTLGSTGFGESVYANLYLAFHKLYFVGFYAVAMLILALHLFHGAWSLFQSLGLDNPDRNLGLRRFAMAVSIGIFLAFASVPAAFYSGLMQAPKPAAQLTQQFEQQR